MRGSAIGVVVAIAAAAFHSTPSVAADRACLDYEPAVVTLSGTITKHMNYGPPNYGEDPARDAKEFSWYLELDDPVCVNGKNDDSPEGEAEKNVRKLQIVYLNGHPKGDGWINHRVSIEGTLFHAITGHHHTNVLIQADKTVKAP
jgi:Domain of unknown function (DUF4431)